MTCSILKTNPNHKKPSHGGMKNANKTNALKRLRKTRLPSDLILYKRTCAISRKIINNAKRKDCEKFCNELKPKTNTKIIWNKIKRIRKTNNINSIPVLQYNGIAARTDKDKAETLATKLYKSK